MSTFSSLLSHHTTTTIATAKNGIYAQKRIEERTEEVFWIDFVGAPGARAVDLTSRVRGEEKFPHNLPQNKFLTFWTSFGEISFSPNFYNYLIREAKIFGNEVFFGQIRSKWPENDFVPIFKG